MKTILGLCSIWAVAASTYCAVATTSETEVLKFFVVSESPVAGGRNIDTTDLPKLGYIGAQPAMLVRSLQSVTNAPNVTSTYAGKTTYERAIQIKMFPADAKRFADLTRENLGKRLLLMLGDTPLIAPVIRMPIETKYLDLTLGERKDVDRIENDLKSLVRHE